VTRSKEQVVQEFRVQSLQDAAMRVIARKGMAAATMQEIAKEAGVAKGTIYLYFRDRDELVEKTLETVTAKLHESVDAALQTDQPFEQKLRAVIAAKLQFFSAHREFFRLYLSMRMPEGNPQQQRRQKRTCQPQYRAWIEQMAGVMREAMDSGEIRRSDPFRLALFLVEGSTAVVLERITEDASPPEAEDVDLIVETILGGISLRRQKRSAH
jgi:AcrR family transcriptional regulator